MPFLPGTQFAALAGDDAEPDDRPKSHPPPTTPRPRVLSTLSPLPFLLDARAVLKGVSSPLGHILDVEKGRRQPSRALAFLPLGKGRGEEGRPGGGWKWGDSERKGGSKGWGPGGEGLGETAGSGGGVIRAEIDVKGRHRRQRESIKREDHIRGDRESFKLQGCCHQGGWEAAGLEPREGGEF